MAKRKTDWNKARQALQKLLQNPDDTARVFEILEALRGGTPERTLRRFRRTTTGRELLQRRTSLRALLSDREYLSGLPAGSLGRAYLAFMDREGISADGLTQASRAAHPEEDPELSWLEERLVDSHDLWHVVTGYQGDLIGEVSLLAFSFAQTGSKGVGLLVGVGFLRGKERGIRRQILRGLVRGLSSEWLPAVVWEDLLPRPLRVVRRELRVGEPAEYETLRSNELPVTGLL
jgi:ubiquinone biosynthesis protein COQ4